MPDASRDGSSRSVVRICRFHDHGIPLDKEHSLRLRKRKKGAAAPLFCIGADRDSITDVHGRRRIDTYRGEQRENAVTLTQREADLIALSNPGAAPPKVLEPV